MNLITEKLHNVKVLPKIVVCIKNLKSSQLFFHFHSISMNQHPIITWPGPQLLRYIPCSASKEIVQTSYCNCTAWWKPIRLLPCAGDRRKAPVAWLATARTRASVHPSILRLHAVVKKAEPNWEIRIFMIWHYAKRFACRRNV